MKTTPEEAVEAAAKAVYSVSRSVLDTAGEFSDEWATWEQASERKRVQCRREARVALEAAAPFIRAQALREAADGWHAYIRAMNYGTTRPISWLQDWADRVEQQARA